MMTMDEFTKRLDELKHEEEQYIKILKLAKEHKNYELQEEVLDVINDLSNKVLKLVNERYWV